MNIAISGPVAGFATALAVSAALVLPTATTSYASSSGQEDMRLWFQQDLPAEDRPYYCTEWHRAEKRSEKEMDKYVSRFVSISRQETAEVMYNACTSWSPDSLHFEDNWLMRSRARTKSLLMPDRTFYPMCDKYWDHEKKSVAKFAKKHHISKRWAGQVLYTVCRDRYTYGVPNIPEW